MLAHSLGGLSLSLPEPLLSGLRKRRITCQQGHVLLDGCLPHGSWEAERDRNGPQLGPPLTARPNLLQPLYEPTLCLPHSQPGTDDWDRWAERGELSWTQQQALVETPAPGECRGEMIIPTREMKGEITTLAAGRLLGTQPVLLRFAHLILYKV